MMDWSQHLGCKAVYRVPMAGKDITGEGRITGVEHDPFSDTWRIYIDNSGYSAAFCNPVVRPLSDVTDEDRQEFENRFCVNKGGRLKVKRFYMEQGKVKLDLDYCDTMPVIEKLYDSIFSQVWCDFKETFFLIRKGYNCGQFQDGSYIVEDYWVRKRKAEEYKVELECEIPVIQHPDSMDCNDCGYVSLTERKQRSLQEKIERHHFCRKYDTRVFHAGGHSRLKPCQACYNSLLEEWKKQF